MCDRKINYFFLVCSIFSSLHHLLIAMKHWTRQILFNQMFSQMPNRVYKASFIDVLHHSFDSQPSIVKQSRKLIWDKMKIFVIFAFIVALLGYVSCQPLGGAVVSKNIDCSLEILSEKEKRIYVLLSIYLHYDFGRTSYLQCDPILLTANSLFFSK